MRDLSGLDYHVVEHEDVCVLARRVEQQKKSMAGKKEPRKPFPRTQPFNKGGTQLTPKPTGNSS